MGRPPNEREWYILHHRLVEMVASLKRRGLKDWHQFLDADEAFSAIMQMDNVVVLDSGYLVVFDMVPQWYQPSLVFLTELLVIRLWPGGDFSDVPRFLEERGREAGCAAVIAGTALASSDRALASLYQNQGFQQAAISLTKEL